MPYNYTSNVTLGTLQHAALHLVQNDAELSEWLDYVDFYKDYRKDMRDQITGMVVLIHDGELLAMWITESAAWYNLNALYHPITYYTGFNKFMECKRQGNVCYDPAKLNKFCDRILATGR